MTLTSDGGEAEERDMIVKTLTLVGGLFGAAIVSQFPEFSQQYTQRLGGQVDALAVVITDFDASAQKADMTREDALASMGGSVFLENRRRDMRTTFARYDRLSEDLTMLRDASPLERLTMPQRIADVELARTTWDNFVPAMPLSVAGGLSALIGYVAGWGGVFAVLWLLAWPFKRRKSKDGLTF
tara:strand:+ start:216328 stop:216879 length:552 start_codon:yes stop_codon:yes gene_type:complete